MEIFYTHIHICNQVKGMAFCNLSHKQRQKMEMFYGVEYAKFHASYRYRMGLDIFLHFTKRNQR